MHDAVFIDQLGKGFSSGFLEITTECRCRHAYLVGYFVEADVSFEVVVHVFEDDVDLLAVLKFGFEGESVGIQQGVVICLG